MTTTGILAILVIGLYIFRFFYSKNKTALNNSTPFKAKRKEKPDIEVLLSSENVNRSIIDLHDYIAQLCKWGEDLTVLNDAQKNFYYIQSLEMEVNNGGFHQYFLNSPGDDTHETVLALKSINADKTANILQDAINIFPKKTVPKDRKERHEALGEIPDEFHAFSGLDSRFLKYDDNLNLLNIEYVRKNKESFK